MPPQNRLAPPLQNSLAYNVPIPLEPGMRLPEPASRFVPRRELENLSIGLGRGQVAAMEGTKQLVTQPIATAQALIEAARQLGTDPRIVLDMLRAARQKAMSGSLGLGELIGENVTPGFRGRRVPTMRELDVYHSTPHRFEPTEANPLGEFDASKIGTGEGAQAYGHGIYTAESQRTAQTYYDQFKQKIQDSFDTQTDRRLDALMQEFGGDTQKAADRFMASVYDTPKNKAAMREEVLSRLEARTKLPYMLKADLPDEMIDRMLDFDKPFLDQSQEIKNLAKSMLPPRVYDRVLMERTGDFIEALGVYNGGQAKAAKLLQQAGIPGIKYLDRSSRIYSKPSYYVQNMMPDGRMVNSFQFDTKAEAEKFAATFKKKMKGQLPTELIGTPRIVEREAQQGTRNFVVFPGEEKKVRILERK